MSADSGVASLMDRMNEIDKRRRMVSMKQKEVETKLSLVSAEHKDLERQCAEMDDEEKTLKTELDQLLADQRQLELQVMIETDRVRRCEVEEPLLAQHCEERIKEAQAEMQTWQTRLNELGEMQSLWQDKNILVTSRSKLESLDAALRDAQVARDQLQSDILQTQSDVARLRCSAAPVKSDGGRSETLPSASLTFAFSAETTAVLPLKEQIQAKQDELQRLSGEHRNEEAALQRQVADLVERCREVSEWLDTARAEAAEKQRNNMRKKRCLEALLCVDCYDA